jgi:hypothetical protein
MAVFELAAAVKQRVLLNDAGITPAVAAQDIAAPGATPSVAPPSAAAPSAAAPGTAAQGAASVQPALPR